MLYHKGYCIHDGYNTDFGELSIGNLIAKVEAGTGFATIKLCHSFWEKSVQLLRQLRHLNHHDQPTDALLQQFTGLNEQWSITGILEILAHIDRANDYPALAYLISEEGWKDGLLIEGMPHTGEESTSRLIEYLFRDVGRIYNGLFWKNAVQDLSLLPFFAAISKRKVIIVGPEAVSDFAQFAGFNDSHFIEVDRERAIWHRQDILTSVSACISEHGADDIVCLLQCGDLAATWLVAELHERFPGSVFIDLGQVLNLCNVGRLADVNWLKVYREKICRCIDAINPQWNHVRNDFPSQSVFHALNDQIRWPMFRKGCIDESTFLANGGSLFDEPENTFGVSLHLEQNPNDEPASIALSNELAHAIHQHLELPLTTKVKPLGNYSQAIRTVCDFAESKAGRPLKWVIPEYTSEPVDALPGSLVLPCDKNAVLDIAALKKLPESDWDAVVVSTFNAVDADIEPLVDYCRDENKYLVIDRQFSLGSSIADLGPDSFEVADLGPGSPWGPAEGAIILISSHSASSFGDFLLETDQAGYSLTKRKPTDLKCKKVVQLLKTFPAWGHLYVSQSKRIKKLGRNLGLLPVPLGTAGPGAIPCVIFRPLCELPRQDNKQSKIVRRIQSGMASPESTARDLVLVSCHPKMAELSDQYISFEISETFGLARQKTDRNSIAIIGEDELEELMTLGKSIVKAIAKEPNS